MAETILSDKRASRDSLTREKTSRWVYKPPSALPDPTPEPGWEFRYIATHVLGQSEPTNVSRKLRDGWEPVKAADHPELMLTGNANGNVEIGGLMLCKMHAERLQAIKAYYENETNSQIVAVNNHYLRNNNPNMPLVMESESTVSKGRGFGTGTR